MLLQSIAACPSIPLLILRAVLECYLKKIVFYYYKNNNNNNNNNNSYKRCNSKLKCAFRDIDQTVFQLFCTVFVWEYQSLEWKILFIVVTFGSFMIFSMIATLLAMATCRPTRRWWSVDLLSGIFSNSTQSDCLRLVHYKPHSLLVVCIFGIVIHIVTMDTVSSFKNV